MNTLTSNVRNKNLKLLDNLDDYKVHHDDIDPRGYTVKLSTGETIGKVDGLLADPNAKQVRYVEVEMDNSIISQYTLGNFSQDDRHALLPVGIIRIDQAGENVYVNGIDPNKIVNYPRFRRSGGYTTRYEIDTNDFLSGFHDFGNTYNRTLYSTEEHRNATSLNDAFYSSGFYTTPRG